MSVLLVRKPLASAASILIAALTILGALIAVAARKIFIMSWGWLWRSSGLRASSSI